MQERDALMTFLTEKLGGMREGSKAHMQRTLICTWLTELYLDKLNSLKSTEAPRCGPTRTLVACPPPDCFPDCPQEPWDACLMDSVALGMPARWTVCPPHVIR